MVPVCGGAMVDQSDLAFRLTTVQFGATATWTQMYHAEDVLTKVDLYERARRALELGRHAPENHDIVTGKRAPQTCAASRQRS